MDKFVNYHKNKNVHIVGVTGSEGSSIMDFCLQKGFKNLTVHDFSNYDEHEKNYILWHKGIDSQRRRKSLESFKHNIKQVTSYWGKDYLKDIDLADFVFVPQSWRLYKQNKPLYKIFSRGTQFYSLTRLYLDYAPACVIAVTGTVGKGSVCYACVQLLENAGKRVYFAGNETWRIQVLSELSRMTDKDFLVLEISHRQLQEGFTRAPHIAVLTNLNPNHLDEVSWDLYRKLKFSLFLAQTQKDIAILNYDDKQVQKLAEKLKSKVYYYSAKVKNMNIKNVQSLYDYIMNTKSNHFQENQLAAVTVAINVNIPLSSMKSSLPNLKSLPARLEHIAKINGVAYYDDLKSTTPWATLSALKKLGHNTILICGGKTKGITYNTFFDLLIRQKIFCILLESELAQLARMHLPGEQFNTVSSLKDALIIASQKVHSGDHILLSPAAAFFYTNFIRGKTSFKKLVYKLKNPSPSFHSGSG